jgi:uncharacterized damage-inducible protein DinB
MTFDHLDELFAYTHTMNERCIDAILCHEESLPERILALQSHILNSHHIWIARINATASMFKPWEAQETNSYALLNNTNLDQTREILRADDPARVVQYANALGQSSANCVHDILFHVVNHGTHHRAQIALLLRESIMPPPSMDWIAYTRR